MAEYQGITNELSCSGLFGHRLQNKPEYIKFCDILKNGPWNKNHIDLDYLIHNMYNQYNKMHYMGYKEYANGNIRLDFHCLDNEGIFVVAKIFTDNSPEFQGIRLEEHYRDLIVVSAFNVLCGTMSEYAKPQIKGNKRVFERHYPYSECGLYKGWFGEFRN